MYVLDLQVVTNLIFSCSGRDFAPPVPDLRSIYSRDVGREIASENWGKKVVEYLSLPLICCYQFSSLAHHRGYAFFALPFLDGMPVEILIILQLHIGLPDTITTQPSSVPILFPRYLSPLLLPMHFFLVVYVDQQVLTQPCWSLAFLAWFLMPGDWEPLHSMESVLKDLPALFFYLVPEGSFPWGPTNPLKSWKSAFLKFRVLTLFFAWPLSLRTANSTSAGNFRPHCLQSHITD